MALLPALVLATACGAATPTHSPAPASTPTPTSLPTATPSPLVSLPQDEAPHDEPVEWWYFNGLLTDGAGNEYSYHFVAFKGQGPANAVPHLMHVSLGDHHRREHFAAETPTLSPVAEDAVGVDVEAGGWTMRGDGAAYQLRFSLGGRTVEIEAVPQREPVLHGGTGLISLGPVGDTYYYSRTRLETAGYIEDQGGRRTVSGTSWMDHQWGAVSGRSVGWDWLSLHLDDGADLMAVVVRDPGTRQLFANYGTYVGPGGEGKPPGRPRRFNYADRLLDQPRHRHHLPHGLEARNPAAGPEHRGSTRAGTSGVRRQRLHCGSLLGGRGQCVGNAGRFAHNRRGIHGTGRIRPAATGSAGNAAGS